MAQVLKGLGSERAWVVHGSDGLDEITTTGVTKVAALDKGSVSTFTIHPEDANLELANLNSSRAAPWTKCHGSCKPFKGRKGPLSRYRSI